jgi:hypothetical protein
MRKASFVVVAVSLLSFASPTAKADFGCAWQTFWSNVERDFHRNNAWPHPFVQPDRIAVQQTLMVQADNGWRMQTMVADHHFNNDTQQLNDSGMEKIRWILTQAPEQRRTIFVQNARTADKNSMRLDAVQQFAATLLPRGVLPPIEQTDAAAPGWPADRINKTYVDFAKNAPAPVLPAPKKED